MAYLTGTVNSIADIRTAITNGCTANGWTWDAGNEVLYKGTVYVKITTTAKEVLILGRTGLTTGSAPTTVGIGPLHSGSLYGFPNLELTFPATYHLFIHVDEVYCIIRYSTDRYQWLSFGKSTVTGITGTGTWVAAIRGAVVPTANVTPQQNPFYFDISTINSPTLLNNVVPFAFGNPNYQPTQDDRNYFVHSDLDSEGWNLHNSTATGINSLIGLYSAIPDIQLTPSSWNDEGVLIPIRAYKRRPSFRASLVAELQFARHLRIDNYSNEQIITLGSDQWMVFPYHQKNSASRNSGVTHTGTVGWAIKYN